ncbi:unknown product [Yersinia phage Yepe2]|uniref:Uncharacterized protein n=2 Tax=Berlinvirus Yepe2 TaxID=2732788 RepID=B3VCM0_9CAUD|nr:unknown product [Yersinia phage Yepe2]ACF15725.1 unknown product [Yersinia phage Yepe2]AFK13484.1 hypothetical protein [Yersinia phage YpP-G]
MANVRIRTIYTLNGRAPDSRDVWDKNNVGLRVGRVDLPESSMVTVEGYTKVEYQVKLSDGAMEVYENFSAFIAAWNGTIESKAGSGFMTVFLNRVMDDTLGLVQIDVRKEWDDSTPDPEPEPSPEMDVAGITKFFTTYVDNPEYLFVWNEMTTVGGEERNRRLPHEMFGVALVNSIKHMRPQTLKALQDALGITATPPATE